MVDYMITAKTILLLMLQTHNFGATIDEHELLCLSLNVYYEAGSENVSGKNAVAHVTLNRAKDKRYPNDLCGVVKQARMRKDVPDMPVKHKCAFSWYCDGLSDEGRFHHKNGKINHVEVAAYELSILISIMSMLDLTIDPTSGSTHYYNHNLVQPTWSIYYTKTIVLDQHTFYRREQGSLK